LQSTNSPTKTARVSFSLEEDTIIRNLIQLQGITKWKTIAMHLTNRTPKQCRERWRTHLSPSVENRPWWHEEDEKLIELYQQFGSKWAKIAKFFYKRSDSNVKNRFRRFSVAIQSMNCNQQEGNFLLFDFNEMDDFLNFDF
jgi:hypothetical protein